MAVEDGFQVDERCCFGDAAAATKCARISNFLASRIRGALAKFDAAHPTRDAAWLVWRAERRAERQLWAVASDGQLHVGGLCNRNLAAFAQELPGLLAEAQQG